MRKKFPAIKSDVITTLRVTNYSISVEPIVVATSEGDRVVPGHTRTTLHLLTEDDECVSIDVPLETFKRFFKRRFDK